MVSGGVMEEIRSLLSQGKTGKEVIELGYASSSVYKVQRRERKRAHTIARGPARSEPGAPASTMVPAAQYMEALG